MSQRTFQSHPEATGNGQRWPWAILLVLGLATLLRLWHLGDWSLWEDEEGSIYFSQQLHKPFPSFFPIFFLALHGVLRLTGISAGAARLLPATIGILSIALVFGCFRKSVSRSAALGAALLLAVNLGHLFFSQSVRYYTTVLVFQLLSMYWFLDGFERGRYRSLVLANVAFALAMLTHFSAVLLTPVYVLYLALMLWRRESAGAYCLKHCLVFGLPLLALHLVFAHRLMQLQAILSDWAIPSARDPLHILLTVGVYFGFPILGLALLAPFLDHRLPQRIVWFWLIASVLPIMELVVIAQLNMVNVTWYYALFALVGFAVLAALSLVTLSQRGHQKVAVLLGAAAGLYSTALLGGYYTTMHGDRPRWEEATQYLIQETGGRDRLANRAKLFATVPGVIAYYLGMDPATTMSQTLVHMLPRHPRTEHQADEEWYIVEAKTITPEYQAWYLEHCTLCAHFETQVGFIDRSVLVYHYPGEGAKLLSGTTASVGSVP